MNCKTKIKAQLFFLLFLICTSQIFSSNEIKTDITSITVNNVVLENPFASDIIIEPSDKITFHFSKNYKFSSDKGLVYLIDFNNGEIKDTINENRLTFSKLKEGIYTLKVQAFVDANYEIIPLTTKFIVRTKTAKFTSSQPLSLPPIAIYILLSILLLEFILILYLLFIKRDKKLVVTEQEEFINLDQAYSVLKKSYKDLNDANRTLDYNIKKMERIIGNLENANLELLSQKESLLTKKTQLEELHAQKEEIYAIAVHDLKNPAAAIRGLIELLDDYDLTAQEQQEIMEGIVASSESIFKLTAELTASISKDSIEEEKALTFETASLKKVIDTVFTVNSAYANKKGVRLINRSSASLPNFIFDPNKMKEVLDNLINNAIKFGTKDTEVILEAFFTDTKLTIEISDNGVGMSDEDLKKVFSKGGKLSAKPTGNESSTGLGLWIVKKLVEAHKGKIWVKSKLGKGSTFVIEIPTSLTTDKVD